jgi:hypothetical protein
MMDGMMAWWLVHLLAGRTVVRWVDKMAANWAVQKDDLLADLKDASMVVQMDANSEDWTD